jgi:hypothetical protein
MCAVLFAASPGQTPCSPATVSAEGAQFNGRPFPATVSAEGRQFNGAPSPAPNWVLRTAMGPAKLAGISSPTQSPCAAPGRSTSLLALIVTRNPCANTHRLFSPGAWQKAVLPP